MYTIKYKPTNLSDFVGNQQSIKIFKKWLAEWSPSNKKTKCALISGVNGIGKSLLVELILNECGYNHIDLSLENERNKEYMSNTIKPILEAKKTFDGKNNALVVSEIDSSSGDHGFISSLVECIKESKIPIICICDDRYCQNIKPVLNYCFDIKMTRPSFDEVYPLIYKVVTSEKIKIGKTKVDKLYAQSNGDIRYILNTLQMGIHKADTTKNIQSSNIFDTTGSLFKIENSLDNKWNTYWMAHDIHGLMVHENYISNSISANELRKLENIAYCADSLSDMDVFDAVFDFDLEHYVAFQTIRATTKCNKRGLVKFPQFLGRISTMNKNKRERIDYTQVKFKI